VVVIYSRVCQVCFTYQNSNDGVRTKQNTLWWLTFPSQTSTGVNYTFYFHKKHGKNLWTACYLHTNVIVPICVAPIHAFYRANWVPEEQSIMHEKLKKKSERVSWKPRVTRFSPLYSGSFFRTVSSFWCTGSHRL
jgi:hypothetical protein